uniref:Ankyrin repeat-containing protein n=1 Tax=Rhizochromulina marina TaxID=1034831 RepID=A0A7S2SBC1_9STRA
MDAPGESSTGEARAVFRRGSSGSLLASPDAVFAAAVRGDPSVVSAFLQQGGSANAAQSDQGLTLLHMAALHGWPAVAQILLDHPDVDPNLFSKGGVTALHFASRKRFTEVARKILDHPCTDPNRTGHKFGWTALHNAAAAGENQMVWLLLQHPQIDVNAIDQTERTPLHWACANMRYEAVKTLIQHPGTDCQALDRHGKMPHDLYIRLRRVSHASTVASFSSSRSSFVSRPTPSHTEDEEEEDDEEDVVVVQEVSEVLLGAAAMESHEEREVGGTPSEGTDTEDRSPSDRRSNRSRLPTTATQLLEGDEAPRRRRRRRSGSHRWEQEAQAALAAGDSKESTEAAQHWAQKLQRQEQEKAFQEDEDANEEELPSSRRSAETGPSGLGFVGALLGEKLHLLSQLLGIEPSPRAESREKAEHR